MAINKCRVCGHGFFKEPLLRYENMPKAAQFLPDAESIKTDKGVDLEVVQCSGCGLVQLSNAPVPYYKEVIRAAAFSEEMKEFRMKQFNNFVQEFAIKGNKVIEIGCGKGEYLSIMQQTGAAAYGIEHCQDSVDYCIEDGLKVAKQFIHKRNDVLYGAPFDAFFIMNFLEHLPDPNVILAGIYNNLTNEAVGIVEVPNCDLILKKTLFSEFINDHLFYFTKDTLCTTLKLNGFDIVDCEEHWYDHIICAVVKKRNKFDISHFHNYQVQLKNEIEKYISHFKDKKVAIWGAGHQALAVIALTNIAEKIKYVLDSATFKQGKYTPATHLPIVPPDTLNTDPVDAVIVMAASYSHEVAGIIRKTFDKNINIAVLKGFGLEEI